MKPEEIFKQTARGPWADVADEQWNDWTWQMRNRVHDLDGLRKVVRVTDAEAEAVEKSAEQFDMGITPYYASLMDGEDAGCPVRLQAVPSLGELQHETWDLDDPLAEERDMPVRGLTHRYPDRVLFYATPTCAMFCRHCTRKRKVADPSTAATEDQIQACIDYIAAHPEVRDVIVSGGDPLTFSTARLDAILTRIRAIPHVEIIRIGTRCPVTNPQRITPELVAMLRKHHPVFVNTHFNHPKECTWDSYRATQLLADAGIPIGNQMVLLRGVNEDPATVKRLNQLLLMMRVKPYYIFFCDMGKGIGHFRTSIETGIRIMEALRGWTSGLAVPYLVIDSPGGGGKIPVIPEYIVERTDEKVVLRNFRGTIHTVYQPK